MFAEGRAVKKDHAQAAKWHKKATDLGLAAAQRAIRDLVVNTSIAFCSTTTSSRTTGSLLVEFKSPKRRPCEGVHSRLPPVQPWYLFRVDVRPQS